MGKIKAKHISIKDFYVRVRKKNKTRGRPSKQEIFLSQVASNYLKEIKPEIIKVYRDAMLYGTGILKVKYPPTVRSRGNGSR